MTAPAPSSTTTKGREEAAASFGQKLLWRIEVLLYDLFVLLLRPLPIDAVSAMGGWIFKVLGPLTSLDRVVRTNIGIAFPDKDQAWIDALVKAQWEQTGRVFLEFPMLDRIARSKGRITAKGLPRLREMINNQEVVVYITMHTANWELMPACVIQHGAKVLVTYRALNNPYFDKRVKEVRASYGVEIFGQKGGAGETGKLIRALTSGLSIGLMIDQRFEQGHAGPLFGVTAHTNPGAIRMALEYGFALQLVTASRLKGANHEVTIHPPIRLEKTGDRDHDVASAVERVNRAVEEVIRENPKDWFWVHHRWPREIYKKEPKT